MKKTNGNKYRLISRGIFLAKVKEKVCHSWRERWGIERLFKLTQYRDEKTYDSEGEGVIAGVVHKKKREKLFISK